MKHKTPEANFEQEIGILARKYKSMYIKLPDPQMLNKSNRQFNREHKRAFDGVLITPSGNYCIELKMDNRKLTPHQADYEKLINMVNGTFFVFRKKRLKKKVIYSIEINGSTVFSCSTCDMLLSWFMLFIRGYGCK